MRIGKGIALIALSLILLEDALSGSAIPTTLDGPFEPVTSPLDQIKFRGHAVDLPKSDRRVRRQVKGFEPEQISLSLSATEDSVWISWITGCLLFICITSLYMLQERMRFACSSYFFTRTNCN
jgi:hypothetical protein